VRQASWTCSERSVRSVSSYVSLQLQRTAQYHVAQRLGSLRQRERGTLSRVDPVPTDRRGPAAQEKLRSDPISSWHDRPDTQVAYSRLYYCTVDYLVTKDRQHDVVSTQGYATIPMPIVINVFLDGWMDIRADVKEGLPINLRQGSSYQKSLWSVTSGRVTVWNLALPIWSFKSISRTQARPGVLVQVRTPCNACIYLLGAMYSLCGGWSITCRDAVDLSNLQGASISAVEW
jgi:hypothetical protein